MDEPTNRKPALSEFSLGGLEHYGFNDYRRLFQRRKWLIAFVSLGMALATAVFAHFLPNIYKASTTILVDSQRVPNDYVKSTVSTNVVDRLATIREQVLSATRLGKIIDELHLYPELRANQPEEVVIERMRKDIDIQVANLGRHDGGLGAFTISFHSRKPVEAARVTNRLASLFIEDNIRAREQQVEGTTSFIDRELEEAKTELDSQEKKIRELKTKYVAELPQSESYHVQAISSLQLEMRGQMDAIDREQQQKVLLQTQMAETPRVVNLDSNVSPEVQALDILLQKEEMQLSNLRQRYGPDFPDVVKVTMEIQDLQGKISAAKKASAGATKTDKGDSSGAPANPVLTSEIAELNKSVKKHEERIAGIKQEIAFHQSKLEAIPIFQQKMDSVMRDYDVARDEYMRLLSLKFNADMSADLEARQKGERFVILDAARVPVLPDSPDRPLIDLAGLGVGLVSGLATAVGLELVDPTVKTEREILAELGGKIFGEVPWLATTRERRLLFFRAILAGLASLTLAAAYSWLVIWSWPGVWQRIASIFWK